MTGIRALKVIEKRLSHLLKRSEVNLGKNSFDVEEATAIFKLVALSFGEDIIVIRRFQPHYEALVRIIYKNKLYATTELRIGK